jgi:prepilin-type N-terminal cleavage/methylation domain-containing protein
MRSPLSLHAGFSLLELSIVLIVLALLFGTLIPGFSAYRQQAENEEARQQLETANEALLGFAIRHGRLPCPAAPAGSGLESPENGGECSHPWNGLLPASTLGLNPVDEHGYALDPWGNPLHYAISAFKLAACGSGPCLTNANGIRNIWNSETPPQPDLRICRSATNKTGLGGTAECAAGNALTKDAVTVVYSLGRNGKQNPASSDEKANTDNDRLFISHDISLPPEEFDDRITWISANIFYARMMSAGRLP